MKDSQKRFVLSTIIAAIGGYLVGILTAPKSGKETRKDIKDTAVKSVKKAEAQLQKATDEITNLLEDVKGKGAKLSGKARTDYDTAVNTALTAKRKAQEILEALKSKEARELSDQELQRALADAAKAVKHLRTYLKG